MADVLIQRLVKKFGAQAAVDGIDLRIAEGEFVTLLGPSGCGKTTTLRCLAGLEMPTSGQLDIGGRTVAAPDRGVFVPPEKRKVGMVFQSYALWPHMTVFGNVAYPLKLAKVPKREVASRVHEILGTVGLADRAQQLATALSGGQQQRVALARAMVGQPRLIFFDEPLSNLDAKLRYTMRQQIRTLHDTFQTTSVYVTHDQEEAIALSDRIVVMNNGCIEQVGTPHELYTKPSTRFVADFMGFQNLWRGTVVECTGGNAAVRVDQSDVTVLVANGCGATAGESVDLAFRASHVRLDPDGAERANGNSRRAHVNTNATVNTNSHVQTRLSGVVARSTYLGSAVNLFVDVGGVKLRGQLDEMDMAKLGPDLPGSGAPVSLLLDSSHVVMLRSGA